MNVEAGDALKEEIVEYTLPCVVQHLCQTKSVFVLCY